MTKKPMTRKTTVTKNPATQKSDQREKAEAAAPEAFELIVSKLDEKDHPHRSRRGVRNRKGIFLAPKADSGLRPFGFVDINLLRLA